MSKEIVKITDYNINNNLLLEQFKSKSLFIEICKTISESSKKLEDAIFEVRDEYWIETAIGIQLDNIGNIVGITRNGRNDTEYRKAIKVQINVNNGSGEPETIITAISGIYGATKVQLIGKNGILYIWTNITLVADDYTNIEKLIPAGVQLILVSGSGIPFVFYGDSDGLGYGYLQYSELTIDFGAGDEKLLFYFNSGNDTLAVNFGNQDYINSNEGGEYQFLTGF